MKMLGGSNMYVVPRYGQYAFLIEYVSESRNYLMTPCTGFTKDSKGFVERDTMGKRHNEKAVVFTGKKKALSYIRYNLKKFL